MTAGVMLHAILEAIARGGEKKGKKQYQGISKKGTR